MARVQFLIESSGRRLSLALYICALAVLLCFCKLVSASIYDNILP